MTEATAADAKPGHNSKGGIAADRLKSFVERIERLNEEREALQADIREVYSEAKSTGFDVKVIRKIIQDRKMDFADLQERDELMAIYRNALGMIADMPLGRAAMQSAGLA